MGTDWREKYLSALAEQDKLEKQVAAHADMLRRTVVHLSSASDGLNETLDNELTLLKEKLRGASGVSVHEQLSKVELAVKGWHLERAKYTRVTCDTMSGFCDDFESLRTNSDTQKSVKIFKRSLTPETQKLYQQAQWLNELRALHQTVIKVAAAPDKNLWQRLNSGTRLLSPNPQSSNSTPQKPLESHPTKGSIQADDASLNEAKANQSDTITIENEGEVEALLHEIFSAIVPTEDLSNAIIEEREKIDHGVNGLNIAHFLRAIRDILQTSYMNYGAEFSNYLVHIDSELARICQVLDTHLEDAARQISYTKSQNKLLETSQKQLSESNQTATNINDLKFAVMEHLTVIEKSLIERSQEQEIQTQQNKTLRDVTDQLQQVEMEAKTTKTLVEKEQHQANRDALTGLPNRAACSQRVVHECERFHRYNHPITLAVCNIDGLAKFNAYGYIIGDRVLKLVAAALRDRLRTIDFVGRYYSDKFLILLPETAPQTAIATLEKIREFIGRTPLNIKGKPVTVTLSFALTTFTEDEDSDDCTTRAMQGVSELRNAGGNSSRIVLHSE